jgi:CHAD domain-containing protein
MSAGGHLDEPPQEGARRLLLDLLESATAARERLAGGEDAEALHDFRVAVRRLRSAQRTFAPELGEAATRRSRRRWSDLAEATGPGRDAEAQLEWLVAVEAGMPPPARLASRQLAKRLTDRRAREHATVVKACRALDPLAARLRQDLSTFTVRLDGEPGIETFGAVAVRRVGELGNDLASRLAAISGAHDEKGAHRARIVGKRLRYGLEVAAPDAKRPLARLKGLQDLLGELHDVHGLMRRVSRLARREARGRAERLAELAIEHGASSDEFRHERGRRGAPWFALLEFLRQRQEALYGEFESEWRAGGEERSVRLIESLIADALQFRAPGGEG